MKIVVDTTEFYDDPHLDGANWRLVQDFIARTPAELVVPEIVFEEAVNHYRERLEKATAAQLNANAALASLVPDVELPASTIEVSAMVAVHRERLQQRIDRMGALKPPIEVEARALVERALRRDRPFDENGRVGFRDAVLWESVVSLLRSAPDVAILVTRNIKDFGSDAGLAPRLRDDLAAAGVPSDQVMLCKGLRALIDEQIRPTLESLDEIGRELEAQGNAECDLWEVFLENAYSVESGVERAIRQWEPAGSAAGDSVELSDPRLASLGDLEGVEVNDVYRLEDGSLGIVASYALRGSVTYTERWFRGWDEYPDEHENTGEVEVDVFVNIVAPPGDSPALLDVDEVEIRPTGLSWPG